MNIMVTGASGEYGSLALKHLKKLAPNENIFALVRDNKKKAELESQGFTVRVADYADVNAMVQAFDGIDRLLFVSVPVFDLQKNVVEAIRQSNIGFVAYTSLCHPEYSKFGLEINHRQTEELIRATGIPHTFLRNSWYMEMVLPMLMTSAKNGDYPYFAKNAKLGWTAKTDLAEAGAKVIAGGEYPEILELSGNAISYEELAKEVESATEKPLNIRLVSKEEYTVSMKKAGISDMGLMLGTAYQEYAQKGNNGEAELTADVLESVIGHKLMTAAEMIRNQI